jgi:predicted HTH transcriptional regulator
LNPPILLEKEKNLALYELIKSGESDTLEFKASMLEPVPSVKIKSDVISNENLDRQLKGMRETLKNEVVTTISAFMNTVGGILLVGIQDDGSVYGLDRDFKAAGGKGDWDSWVQVLANLIRGKIGTEFVNYIKVERVMHDNKTVAKIVVEKSRRPAYVEIKDAAFYVRSLNTTTPLNTKQAHDYITDHWSIP